jgi:adenylate cyclase
MLAAFRSRRFDEAGALLVEARAVAGGKLATLYDFYEARITEYKENPPPADWDGRTLAESK